MANATSIPWTDFTINAGRGCVKVSPGCQFCYSERDDKRWGKDFTDVRRRPKAFTDMFALSRKIGDGDARVFLNSMTDTFHQAYDDDYIAELLTVAALTPNLTYQVLTKRHPRLRTFLTDNCRCGAGHAPTVHLRSKMADIARKYAKQRPDIKDISAHVYSDVPYPLPNVWFGVSAEDQKRANLRVPSLLRTPAAVRFVSAEPLLGPIDFRTPGWLGDGQRVGLDWIIVGGESGFGDQYRPMALEWAGDILAQGVEHGTAMFMKQLGTSQAKTLRMSDFKGENWDQWPSDLAGLRIREFPTTPTTC